MRPLTLGLVAILVALGMNLLAPSTFAGHWEWNDPECHGSERKIRESGAFSYFVGYQSGKGFELKGESLSGGVLYGSCNVLPSGRDEYLVNSYVWVKDHPEDSDRGEVSCGAEGRVFGGVKLRGTGDAQFRSNLVFRAPAFFGDDRKLVIAVNVDPVPPVPNQWWQFLQGTLGWHSINETGQLAPRMRELSAFETYRTSMLESMVGTSGGVSLAELKVEGRMHEVMSFEGGLQ